MAEAEDYDPLDAFMAEVNAEVAAALPTHKVRESLSPTHPLILSPPSSGYPMSFTLFTFPHLFNLIQAKPSAALACDEKLDGAADYMAVSVEGVRGKFEGL